MPKSKKNITGYGAGGFKINGERFEGSILITGETVAVWNAANAADITPASLTPLLNGSDSIEVVLVGTGGQLHAIDPAIKQAFKANHIGFEIMDTGAACRTYNVLLAEGRRVAAALVAV